MKSVIIYDILCGNLSDDILLESPAEKAKMAEAKEKYFAFIETLSKEQKDMFDSLVELGQEHRIMLTDKYFQKGVFLGIKLMNEVYSDVSTDA